MVVREISQLRGPNLFREYFELQPRSFENRDILALHCRIEEGMRSKLREIGGPELPEIRVEVLSKDQYAARFQALGVRRLTRREIERRGGHMVTRTEAGALYFDIVYNRYGLHQSCLRRRETTTAMKTVGQVMVHEISPTLYGRTLAQRITDESGRLPLTIETVDIPLSRVCEGWACLFSDVPHPPAVLLKAERLWPRRHTPPLLSVREELEEGFRERHVLGALAFLKIEMAFGFDRLLQFMHLPPGFTQTETGYEEGDIIRATWEEYDRANQILGDCSIPYEYIAEGVEIFPRLR